jgi:hypothetical protein
MVDVAPLGTFAPNAGYFLQVATQKEIYAGLDNNTPVRFAGRRVKIDNRTMDHN